MSKLYFNYWAMWAWKSLELIKVAYNYIERGQKVIIFNSDLDTRFEKWKITSRSWNSLPSIPYNDKTEFFIEINNLIVWWEKINCILVDESQFLSEKQVEDCAKIAVHLDVPVICYWIKTDFLRRLFEWSKRLLELSQSISEIKTICWCGKKATMNARIIDWKMITVWEKILIWENNKYISLCLKHYLEYNIWDKN